MYAAGGNITGMDILALAMAIAFFAIMFALIYAFDRI
jgi:hypothetical protein